MKVSVKLEREMLVIKLDKERSFSHQQSEIEGYLSNMKNFLSKGDIKVGYDGLELSYSEELELCRMLDNAFSQKVKFCYKTAPPEAVIRHITSHGETFLKKHFGIVRAGETVKSNGDLIVVGDVNPTATLIARGDIFVLGILRGSAYAGCDGDDKAMIYAKEMRPENLRISNIAGYCSNTFKIVENGVAKVENGVITMKMM
ncbi:MAG: septum site-determining protein MinC [Clostridia bacterium]